MPREYVLGNELIREDEEGLVTVGWSEETVQIATTSRHPQTHDTVHEGFWVNLDRRGLNQLIRKLRRARDSAFGRDE